MQRFVYFFRSKTLAIMTALLLGSITLTACTPTVQIAVPDKPIEINLNVKIQHEIRVKVDQELDTLFDKDSALF